MTLLHPSETVSRRWAGSLQARLRRAPIEVFLRSRGLKVCASGASQLTDNLIRATVDIVGQNFTAAKPVPEIEQVLIGSIACSVCHELTSLIAEPEAWRIAALVSSAELLSAGIGRQAAAFQAAATARDFVVKRQTQSVMPMIQSIGIQAALAVKTTRPEDLMRAVQLISECLAPIRAASTISTAVELAAASRPRPYLIACADRTGLPAPGAAPRAPFAFYPHTLRSDTASKRDSQ
jgi:hypothetical protein